MSGEICKLDGCVEKADRQGFCCKHYARYKRYGDPLAGGEFRHKKYKGATCSVPGCTNKIYAKGLCPKHYIRAKALKRRKVTKQSYVETFPGEIWKDISGYEGKYQVSTYGRVKSVARHISYSNGQLHFYEEHLLTPGKGPTGYLSIKLGDKGREAGVHRLVAETFIPNPKDKGDVNHIDGNKSNNAADNLEWVTRKENMVHCRDVLKKQTGLKKIRVKCVETGEIFKSLSDACRMKNVNCGHLSEVINKKSSRLIAGGYHWEKC